MSQTITTKQVSSPYAIYENETKIACLPYEVIRIASQFVSKDYSKQLLTGIHLKVDNKNISIESTDGHRAFFFRFPKDELGFKLEKNVVIPGAILKSQVKNCTKILVTDSLITFMNEEIFLSSIHYSAIEGTYPDIQNIVPDSFSNMIGKEFSFNAIYLAEFCNQVKKVSSSKCLTFNGNIPSTPFIINTEWDIKNPFESLEGFKPVLNYLIMPIMKKKLN
tara:strand:- start:664 stop:1326 length:663 start_codon:yes stop_codon:yes gene_type:complete